MNFFTTILMLLAIAAAGITASAQSRFRVEVEQQIVDSTLLIDFYIQKTVGEDFVLGSSNFAVRVSHQYLDMTRMRKVPGFAGKWDISASPRSYASMGLGGDTYVALTIKKRTGNSGKGYAVTSERERIGRVAIPITDFCGTNTVSWITDPIAINSFDLKDLKPYAEFVNPAPDFAFQPIPEAPKVQIKEDSNVICAGQSLTLITPFKGAMQWLYEGKPIEGATGSTLVVTKPGNYAVRALHCIRNVDSAPVEVQVNPLPEALRITQINDTLMASDGENYQWYFENEPMEGATEKFIKPSKSGVYKVETWNSCGAAMSDEFDYVINKTDTIKNITEFVVYPNPSLGDAVVRYNVLEAGYVSIKIFNMLGELVVTLTEAYHKPGTYELPFVATELGYGAGVYFVRMNHAGTTRTIRVIDL